MAGPVWDHPKWPAHSTSTRFRGNISLEQNWNDDLVNDNGIKLVKIVKNPKVSDAFQGMAYLRILAGHRIRIKRELKRLEEEQKRKQAERGPCQNRSTQANAIATKETIAICEGIKFGDLKMVNCCRCDCRLLGESHEWVRLKVLHHHNDGVRKRLLKIIPPPIAAVLHERPYCQECLELKKTPPTLGVSHGTVRREHDSQC